MERRELYEPEDIEQLLLTRSFDELLADERTFVLRHLGGRDEYERMRTLLLRLSTEAQVQDAVDADPAVRDRVLDVFRSEQRPRYTIWLNSVAAFLVPQRPADRWRMALALGSVAVVISLALLAPWMDKDMASGTIAHVREVRRPTAPDVDATNRNTPADNRSASATSAAEKAEGSELTAPSAPIGDNSSGGAPSALTRTVTSVDMTGGGLAEENAGIAEQAARPAMDAIAGKKEKAMNEDEGTIHVVQAAELLSNQSLASGTTVVGGAVIDKHAERKSARLEKARSRAKDASDRETASLPMDPSPYMSMLRAAW